jgi:hypothetical protein
MTLPSELVSFFQFLKSFILCLIEVISFPLTDSIGRRDPSPQTLPCHVCAVQKLCGYFIGRQPCIAIVMTMAEAKEELNILQESMAPKRIRSENNALISPLLISTQVNCPFYFKIGACRHGDRCSRQHHRPPFSQTVIIQHMWQVA